MGINKKTAAVPYYEILTGLRKELHKFPELSGKEYMTASKISEVLLKTKPDRLITGLGGNGVAAIFRGTKKGPRVMLRAELDALPINETNEVAYRSVNQGISHKCGHDGHMSVAVGVAMWFSENRPGKGEMVILFQPSEENGEGALAVLSDPVFGSIEPDYVLAMHNLPGYDLHEIVLGDGVFAAASEGMIINLKGKTAHAGEPEKGISPSLAVSRILKELPLLPGNSDLTTFSLITIIHAVIGERAFGTSPGHAVIMATLRSSDNEEMKKLKDLAAGLVKEISSREKLDLKISWTEQFPATENSSFLISQAGRVAEQSGFRTRYIENTFRWSEDFGWFTRKYPGMLFGMGAGKEHPELHHPDYDFPDELINSGVRFIHDLSSTLLTELNGRRISY